MYVCRYDGGGCTQTSYMFITDRRTTDPQIVHEKSRAQLLLQHIPVVTHEISDIAWRRGGMIISLGR